MFHSYAINEIILAPSVTSHANLILYEHERKDRVMDKQEMFFTISEFGKRLTTTVKTLRYYAELGLLVPTNRNAAGHKLYGFDDLTKLQQIQSLKFLGYSLQNIKSLVNEEADVSVQLEESLNWQHKLLTEKRKELNQAIDAIEHVQYLLEKGKIVTWKVLSSLLFRIENEQEQIEWIKEFYSEDMARRLSEVPKEQHVKSMWRCLIGLP